MEKLTVQICTGTLCYIMGGSELQLLGEYLPAGQHIEAGCIEADGRPVAAFTVVGHKRICRFAPVQARTLAVRITASRAEPALRLLAAYR